MYKNATKLISWLSYAKNWWRSFLAYRQYKAKLWLDLACRPWSADPWLRVLWSLNFRIMTVTFVRVLCAKYEKNTSSRKGLKIDKIPPKCSANHLPFRDNRPPKHLWWCVKKRQKWDSSWPLQIHGLLKLKGQLHLQLPNEDREAVGVAEQRPRWPPHSQLRSKEPLEMWGMGEVVNSERKV